MVLRVCFQLDRLHPRLSDSSVAFVIPYPGEIHIVNTFEYVWTALELWGQT